MRNIEALIAYTYYKNGREKKFSNIEKKFKYTTEVFDKGIPILEAVKNKQEFMKLDVIEVDLLQLMLIDIFNSNRNDFPNLKYIVENKNLRQLNSSDIETLTTDEYEILNALLSNYGG